MRKTILLLVWALVNSIAFAKQANLERNAIQVASTTVVVPTSANAVGATGSTFQTRISIFNPTAVCLSDPGDVLRSVRQHGHGKHQHVLWPAARL